MASHFFAYLGRMKLIQRWSLMRNTLPENIQEHSQQVAIIAHCLALIGNRYYNRSYDPSYGALLALFHDADEVFVGDLPTPVKYFNPEIRASYQAAETMAKEKLLSLLPQDLQEDYRGLFFPPQDAHTRLVKAADKIAAYIKCLEETAAGNGEFSQARESLKKELAAYDDLPEVKYFIEEFVGSFLLTLDEMS